MRPKACATMSPSLDVVPVFPVQVRGLPKVQCLRWSMDALPNPNEPGISVAERLARLKLRRDKFKRDKKEASKAVKKEHKRLMKLRKTAARMSVEDLASCLEMKKAKPVARP